MVDIDTDTDSDPELGTATIAYETPDETDERATVDNDRIAYTAGCNWFRDSPRLSGESLY